MCLFSVRNMVLVGHCKINKTISAVCRLQFFGIFRVSKIQEGECYLENGIGEFL